jgi:hypothetical protein
MNQLLNAYIISVDYPDVSGAEHLEMLDIREQLSNLENELGEEEKQVLAEADQKLIINASKIYSELSRFISFREYRESHNISPQRWWWYLDVLSYLPTGFETKEKVRR